MAMQNVPPGSSGPPGVPFLGIGWGFPIRLESAEGREHLAHAEYEDSVRQGVLLVLSTSKGERVMRPDFGCDIHDLLFAPNDATTCGMAESMVDEALREWEPRIDVLRVAAEARGALLSVSVDYRVRKTDARVNLVYPFYLDRPMR